MPKCCAVWLPGGCVSISFRCSFTTLKRRYNAVWWQVGTGCASSHTFPNDIGNLFTSLTQRLNFWMDNGLIHIYDRVCFVLSCFTHARAKYNVQRKKENETPDRLISSTFYFIFMKIDEGFALNKKPIIFYVSARSFLVRSSRKFRKFIQFL